MKICSKCKKEKPLDSFYKDKYRKDGVSSRCKECLRPIASAARAIYVAEHREKVNEQKRNRYYKNREQMLAVRKQWRKNNPEKARELSTSASKRWRTANPEKAKKADRRSARKTQSTPSGQLNRNIARGMRRSIKAGTKKNCHWELLVDFTVEQLKNHLENQFTSEMSWDNQGGYWHIDHKIPISTFNFTSPDHLDFKRCWALENLQPLEATQNLRKGSKLKEPFQPSLRL